MFRSRRGSANSDRLCVTATDTRDKSKVIIEQY